MRKVDLYYGILVALVVLVLAILSLSGAAFSKYKNAAWWYTVLVGSALAYFGVLVLVGSKSEFDTSKGFLDRLSDKVAETVGITN